VVARGTRDITITPTWDVSDDVEKTGTESHARTFSVPEFVAMVYDNVETQIRTIATKLANTDELARISETDQAELHEIHSCLDSYIESNWDDCCHGVNNVATFNEQRYELVEARCNSFAASIEAKIVAYGEDRADMKAAIAKLAAQQMQLHHASESAFNDIGDKVAALLGEHGNAPQMENETRDRHENYLHNNTV